MTTYLIDGDTLTDIADSIRGKTGGSSPIPVPNMSTAIDNIPSGSPEIFNVNFLSQEYPSLGTGEKHGRRLSLGYTSNNWDNNGMWCNSTYATAYGDSLRTFFVDGSSTQYKYTITLVLGTMWDDTLTSSDPPTSKACYYIQHWGNRQVTGLGYHNTANDGGNWRITYNSNTNTSVQILDLPLTDIHDLDDETIVITYIPSTGKATYTIKNVDYQVDVRNNVNDNPPSLGIGGYDNTALCYCRYKNITVDKELLTA